MSVDDPRFANINWDSLLRRLTACAAKWFLQENCLDEEAVLPATGKSAKELAFEVLTEFIKGNIELVQQSDVMSEGELFSLLRRVMRHDFLDLVKKGRAYKRTTVLD